MNNILYAVLSLGALSAAFGLVLAFAAKKFEIEVDERQSAIEDCLPGANCGGCGFAGCSAYAAAVVGSGAPTNACVPGGNGVSAQIAAIMGVEAQDTQRCVALVKCSGSAGHMKKNFEYSGISDCVAAMRLGGGNGANACPYGCLGFGTCVKSCKFEAIYLENGIAHVDHKKCTGCMTCAKSCPKSIIVKVPFSAEVTVACSSKDKGSVLRGYCDLGCLACTVCEKTCQYDAIHVIDGRAAIDYDKCVGCGKCAEKCPRHLIRDAKLRAAN